VFRAHRAAFVFVGIAAVENPLQPKRAETVAHLAKPVGIAPRPTRVIHRDTSTVLRQDLSQRDSNRRMKFALDVNALAGRKCGIEIGGIFKFELGTTHSLLPSSALSESGSRGRSLPDPLSFHGCALSRLSSPVDFTYYTLNELPQPQVPATF